MNLQFSDLFEHLMYCRDSTRILLREDEVAPVKVLDHWLFGGSFKEQHAGNSRLYKKEADDENYQTMKLFIRIIEGEFEVGNEKIAKVVREIKALQDSSAALTAGKIRRVYQRIIAAQVEGARRVAAIAREDDRIVYEKGKFRVHNAALPQLRGTIKNENRATLKRYYDELVEEWGEARITRALKRYNIDMDRMKRNGETLTPAHVNKITLGLADYHREDLISAWHRLTAFSEGKLAYHAIPRQELRKLERELKISFDTGPQAVAQLLQAKIGVYKEASFKRLPEKLKAFVRNIAFVDERELELMFQGCRIEGPVNGGPPTEFDNWVHRNEVVDKERLQLYKKIMTHHPKIPEDKLEIFYDEILAKAMVKKEMPEDVYMPTPWKHISSDGTEAGMKWYEVKKRIVTGRAKFAYYLEGHRLKDRLVYRSTSSSPSALDSFTTVLTDLYPFAPPGYKWKRYGQNEEREILFKNKERPLRLVGHSLGGSHVQLFLMNFIKQHNVIVNDLPDRDIECVTFDSPLIKKNAARTFSYWLDQPENKLRAKRISIEHYSSKGDPVSFLGDVPLGWKCDRSTLKNFKFVSLSSKNPDHPEMKLHPHNRRYYSARPGVDFIEKEMNVDQYHRENWRFVEVIRRIVGLFLYPVILVFGFLKRFFFGWRGGIPGIVRVFHKIFPPKPLAGTN